MTEKEKILLVGAGGFGRVVSEHARKLYDCAFVDDGYPVGEVLCDIPVVGHLDDIAKLYGTYKKLVVVIGNNKLREEVYQKASKIGYMFPNITAGNVYISPYATVGHGCVFLNNCVIQNGSTVGNGVLLNPGVEIHHGCAVDDYALIYTNSCIRTYAHVEKRAWIGSNVTISNDVIVPADGVVPNGKTLFKEQR